MNKIYQLITVIINIHDPNIPVNISGISLIEYMCKISNIYDHKYIKI